MARLTESTRGQAAAQIMCIVGAQFVNASGKMICAAPADVSQIAEVLRVAKAEKLAVVPSGTGTKLGWGNPVETDIQLSLRRVCSVKSHSWQDMTCTVEAGVAWEKMQAALRKHGQMVALDPLWPRSASVGGVIATNDSGAMRLRYGGLRDLVIGMTVILADGTVAKSGGMVVKNVAGYDVHKLMTGSFGTLGVIADVTFRLHAIEESATTWTVSPRGRDRSAIDSFSEPLLALLDSHLAPSGVQLRTSKDQIALDVRIATVPECVPEQLACVRDIFKGFEINDSDASVWGARERLFDNSDSIVVKVAVLPANISDACSAMHKWAGDRSVDLSTVAQATGIMTVGFDATIEVAGKLISGMRETLAASGGTLVILRSPHRLKDLVDPWGQPPNALPLTRAIKRRFDPEGNLSPGRFFGGI